MSNVENVKNIDGSLLYREYGKWENYRWLPRCKDLEKEDLAVHNYAKLSHCSNNENQLSLYRTLVADKKQRWPPKIIESYQIWANSYL